MLRDILIPFQEDSVQSVDPGSSEDNLYTLYEKQLELFTKSEEGLKKTFPWSLSSNGGRPERHAGRAGADWPTQPLPGEAPGGSPTTRSTSSATWTPTTWIK